MCCCARERTAGPLIHIYTRSSLRLYPVCVLCVRVIYTHIIHPIPPPPPSRPVSLSSSVCLYIRFCFSARLSLYLSFSDNMCPKILFRRCCGEIKTKRCEHRLNDDYHKHGPVYTGPLRAVNNVYSNRL